MKEHWLWTRAGDDTLTFLSCQSSQRGRASHIRFCGLIKGRSPSDQIAGKIRLA